jgi:hypothetical protein
MNVVMKQPLTETQLIHLMLRQIESWPAQADADLVAATLYEGICRVIEGAHGRGSVGQHVQRIGQLAASIFGDNGGGPTHRMTVAA